MMDVLGLLFNVIEIGFFTAVIIYVLRRWNK